MTVPESTKGQTWLLLATILRPQGRKGEVLADLFTDFPERFQGEPRVFLASPGFAGPPSQAREAHVVSFFLPVGRNLGRIVLHLQDVASIEAAETLSGLEIIVPQQERREAVDDASYISDLLGCTVFNVPPGHPPADPPHPTTTIGMVDDVQFPTASDGLRRLEDAAPLLVVLSPSGDEILIPFVKAFLVNLDVEARHVLMTLPEGLLDVNARPA